MIPFRVLQLCLVCLLAAGCADQTPNAPVADIREWTSAVVAEALAPTATRKTRLNAVEKLGFATGYACAADGFSWDTCAKSAEKWYGETALEELP